MGEERKNVLPGGGSITISRRDAAALIAARDGTAALLYLHILSDHGQFSAAEAAEALGCGQGEIRRAMGTLAQLHLVEYSAPAEAPEAEELPEYSAEDVRRELVSGNAFRSLVDEVQQAMGRILSSEGLMKLYGIYDYLGLPPEVILTLVNHCVDECRRRSGPSRVPTMGYVEKAAFAWHRAGIFTLEEADRYLRAMEDRRSVLMEMRRVLGIRERDPSPSERKYLESWADMGFSAGMVELAYDRTVMKTGKLSWRYLDSILNSWRNKGLMTPEAVESGDTPPARRDSRDGAGAPAPERPTGRDELAELQKFIDSMNGQN